MLPLTALPKLGNGSATTAYPVVLLQALQLYL